MLLAAALVFAGGITAAAPATAKAPGATYCFRGFCHRVLTLAETRALVGRDTTLATSYYDSCRTDRFNPCGLTSSGEEFRPDQPDNAASPIYPDGTLLVLWNPATGRAAAVRINNAGPYLGRRRLDVSRATARALGFEGQGVIDLVARVVAAPGPAEARYKKWRRYAPVPGDLGTTANLDDAHDRAALALAHRALETGEADALRLALTTLRAPIAAAIADATPPAKVRLNPAGAPLDAAPPGQEATLVGPARLTSSASRPLATIAALPPQFGQIAGEQDESWSAVVADLAAAAQARARRGVRPTTAAVLPLRTASLALDQVGAGIGELARSAVRYARASARAGVDTARP